MHFQMNIFDQGLFILHNCQCGLLFDNTAIKQYPENIAMPAQSKVPSNKKCVSLAWAALLDIYKCLRQAV